MPRNARFYCTRPPIGTPGRLAPHPISKIAAIWPFSTDLGRERFPRRPLPDLDVLNEVQRRDPPSASRPTLKGSATPGRYLHARCIATGVSPLLQLVQKSWQSWAFLFAFLKCGVLIHGSNKSENQKEKTNSTLRGFSRGLISSQLGV